MQVIPQIFYSTSHFTMLIMLLIHTSCVSVAVYVLFDGTPGSS